MTWRFLIDLDGLAAADRRKPAVDRRGNILADELNGSVSHGKRTSTWMITSEIAGCVTVTDGTTGSTIESTVIDERLGDRILVQPIGRATEQARPGRQTGSLERRAIGLRQDPGLKGLHFLTLGIGDRGAVGTLTFTDFPMNPGRPFA